MNEKVYIECNRTKPKSSTTETKIKRDTNTCPSRKGDVLFGIGYQMVREIKLTNEQTPPCRFVSYDLKQCTTNRLIKISPPEGM